MRPLAGNPLEPWYHAVDLMVYIAASRGEKAHDIRERADQCRVETIKNLN